MRSHCLILRPVGVLVLFAVVLAACGPDAELTKDRDIIASAPAPTADGDLAQFGHRQGLDGGQVPTRDLNPLTVVRYQTTGNRGTAVDPGVPSDDELEALFERAPAGAIVPSILTFFSINSRFDMSLEIDYVDTTQATNCTNVNEIYSDAITAAANATDRSGFDRNGDGVVDGSEWWIVIINNCTQALNTPTPAITRSAPDVVVDGITYQLDVTSANKLHGAMDVIAHEMVHLMDGRGVINDRYNNRCGNIPNDCDDLSLMDFSTSATEAVRQVVMLDACHRFGFGWLNPVVVDLSGGDATSRTNDYLFATDWDIDVPDSRMSILIHDSSRPTNEFFLLETRREDGPDLADARVAKEGAVLWRCMLDGSGGTIGRIDPVTPNWVRTLPTFGTSDTGKAWTLGSTIPIIWSDQTATHTVTLTSVTDSNAALVTWGTWP